MAQRVDDHRCAKPRANLCKAFLRHNSYPCGKQPHPGPDALKTRITI